MEEYRSSERHDKEETRVDDPAAANEYLSDRGNLGQGIKTGSEKLLRSVLDQQERKSRRKKWGKGLIVVGVVTILDSCSFFPIPLMGPLAIWVGGAMMLVGCALLIEAPRMRETNEALMIALRNRNRLTVPRLALEMDISFKRAEKIIQKLVKNGVAEIDLDEGGPDGGITYRIKGV
ncbi:MAG: hypothetical protein P8182_10275 [Deltaproteobacteria bacterium]